MSTKVQVTHLRPLFIKNNRLSGKEPQTNLSRPTFYQYTEYDWRRGVNSLKFWDASTKSVKNEYASYNNKFDDVSILLCNELLTPTNKIAHIWRPPAAIIEWRKRKIIHSICIKRLVKNSTYNNTQYYRNLNDVSFSIVVVKKLMLEKQYENDYAGALISDKSYWSDNQLLPNPENIENHLFINNHYDSNTNVNAEINLTNLSFDLSFDEDLVFVYNYHFYENEAALFLSSRVSAANLVGVSEFPTDEFCIVVAYSTP